MERAEDIFLRIVEKGEKAINEFITTRQSEELFLDFKRSKDDGNGTVLNQNDRSNLVKAISGFGNSDGGVVVWGIDCSKDFDSADVAKAKYPITNVKRFVSWLEGAVSGCTVPPHIGVKNHPIIINKKERGFVATYIPKSNTAPHQMVGKLQYYIRAGSNFIPTPHQVLAGMFGRRPQPHVFHMFLTGPAKVIGNNIQFEIGFLIRNQGPGIARDLFINLWVFSVPGDNCTLNFQRPDATNWMGQWSFGRHISTISTPNFCLAPEAQVQPIITNISLAPPFSKKIKIDGICGSAGAPAYKFTIENTPKKVSALYEEFLKKHRNQDLTKEEGHKFVENVLRIQGAKEE